MAGRAIWKGVISFGAVSVPVKLYSAVREERVQFHLLHDQDEVRLRQQMVCPVDDEVVDREHQQKGLEVAEEEYVVVEEEELDKLEPESSRDIEVKQFVKLGEIDPRFYDRPYYLGPDGDEKTFRKLAAALHKENLAGVCQWVMRKRAYLGALKFCGNALCLVALRYADELTPSNALKLPKAKLDPREKETASYLIDTMSGEFDPSQYHDDYQERLAELVARKARGQKAPVKRISRPKATQSGQLLKMLQASLKKAQAAKK